jgi:hypothetical protein
MTSVANAQETDNFLLLDLDNVRRGSGNVKPGWAMGDFYPLDDLRYTKEFEIKEWDVSTIQTLWRNHADVNSEYIAVYCGVLTVIFGYVDSKSGEIIPNCTINVGKCQRIVIKTGVWRKFCGSDDVQGISIRKSPERLTHENT